MSLWLICIVCLEAAGFCYYSTATTTTTTTAITITVTTATIATAATKAAVNTLKINIEKKVNMKMTNDKDKAK